MTSATNPATPFDTYESARRLKEAGFNESQADCIAEVTRDAVSGLCTKEDLDDGLSSVREEIARTKDEVSREISVTRELLTKDITRLTAYMAKLEKTLRGDMAEMKDSQAKKFAEMKDSHAKDLSNLKDQGVAVLNRALLVHAGAIVGILAALSGIALGIAGFL